MRCGLCRSYVPENLRDPSVCPSCQNPLVDPPRQSSPSPQGEPALTQGAQSAPVFAPEKTLKLTMSFGPTGSPQDFSLGSVSFGAEGFSVVLDGGTRWEKIFYRDLSSLRLIDADLFFEIKGVETRLSAFPAALPAWAAFLLSSSKLANLMRGKSSAALAALLKSHL